MNVFAVVLISFHITAFSAVSCIQRHVWAWDGREQKGEPKDPNLFFLLLEMNSFCFSEAQPFSLPLLCWGVKVSEGLFAVRRLQHRAVWWNWMIAHLKWNCPAVLEGQDSSFTDKAAEAQNCFFFSICAHVTVRNEIAGAGQVFVCFLKQGRFRFHVANF